MDGKAQNRLARRLRRSRMIELILQGIRSKDIYEQIMREYQVSKYTVKLEMTAAHKEIKRLKVENAEVTTNLHLMRYEQLYKELKGRGWNGMAMQVLKAKENLLGVHKKNKGINVKVESEIVVSVDQLRFDMKSLSEPKQNRLDELLAKVTPNEL